MKSCILHSNPCRNQRPWRAVPLAVALAAAAVLVAPSAPAEVLLLKQAIEQEPVNGPGGVPRPTRGLTMEQVRQRFGAPVKELPWVGDPPITRWVYDRFTVYFEGNRVINSVVNR